MGEEQSKTSKLSSDIQKILVRREATTANIIVTPVKLEIRQSAVHNAGNGVFACEDIPKNTVFLELIDPKNYSDEDVYSRTINDLAYHGTTIEYESDDNIMKNINVGYVNKASEYWLMGTPTIYHYAMIDIKSGEELSRFYGITYWEETEFWQTLPECKYLQTRKDEDLPSKYIFLDTMRVDVRYNHNMSLFGKKEGDKYYYLAGYGKGYFENNFFNKREINFETKEDMGSAFTDVTKPDFSKYEPEEEILKVHMKRDTYLMSEQYQNSAYEKEMIESGKMKMFKNEKEMNEYFVSLKENETA